MKKIILLLNIFTSILLMAQYNVPNKIAPHSLSTSSNENVAGGNTYMWTVGEPIVFTGLSSNSNFTQGFNQPMICRALPVVGAFNQTSCALPYTVTATGIFDMYRWYRGNTFIVSASTDTYIPVRNGNYYALVGDSTGCVLRTPIISVDLSAKNFTPLVTASGAVNTDTTIGTTSFVSYQWYVIAPNGTHYAIVDAINQSYRPYFSGIYYVKVNTAEQCVSYSLPYSLVNNSLQPLSRYIFEYGDGTIYLNKYREITEPKLSVYPIPVKKSYSVDLESTQLNEVELALYSADGKLLKTEKVLNNTGKLVLNYQRDDAPAGKYILSVKDGDKKYSQGLIFE